METKEKFKGLVYIKQHKIGTRSEGPDYYLQTVNAEYRLKYTDIHLWEKDYYLEFFCRKFVEVTGEYDKEVNTISVKEESDIKELCVNEIPK